MLRVWNGKTGQLLFPFAPPTARRDFRPSQRRQTMSDGPCNLEPPVDVARLSFRSSRDCCTRWDSMNRRGRAASCFGIRAPSFAANSLPFGLRCYAATLAGIPRCLQQLVDRLFHELEAIPLIDPHTHINPHAAASKTLADILGYHYYTELAHSAGLDRARIEEPGLDPKEKVRRLVELAGTAREYDPIELAPGNVPRILRFPDERITADNWEPLYDRAAAEDGSLPIGSPRFSTKSRLEQVFLTNDFDDPLEGFNTSRYIPCLRTDDLVFHFAKPAVRQRLAKATGIEAGTASQLVEAIGKLFDHFTSRGARACAISLPPDFEPCPSNDQRSIRS